MTSSPSLIPELLSSYLYYRLIFTIVLSLLLSYLCYRLKYSTLSHHRPDLIFIIDSILSLLSTQHYYRLKLSTRLYFHLCSEPMDFVYYAIRRRDRTHGEERVD